MQKNYQEFSAAPIATGGSNFLWRIHSARRLPPQNDRVSLFLLEKSSLPSRDAATIVENFKRGCNNASKFNHPNVLHVYKVEETRSHLIVETEPISVNLGNVLCRSLNVPSTTATPLLPQQSGPAAAETEVWRTYSLADLERQWILYNVGVALRFLIGHTSKTVHLQVAAENIYLSGDRKTWKLFGFDFATPLSALSSGNSFPYSAKYKGYTLSAPVLPLLSYTAPELIVLQKYDMTGVFVLLLIHIYFHSTLEMAFLNLN